MYAWKYLHRTDDQERFQVPASYQEDETVNPDRKYVLTKGATKCLYMFPFQTWKLCITENLPKNLDADAFDDLMQELFGSAFVSKADAQYRIKLPEELREYAEIKKDVVLLGVKWRIEIWNPEILAAHKLTTGFQPEEIARMVYRKEPEVKNDPEQ